MSIGTALVLIAIGVFFCNKPVIFQKTVKFVGICLGILAFVGIIGFFIDQRMTAKQAQQAALDQGVKDIGDMLDSGLNCWQWNRAHPDRAYQCKGNEADWKPSK
jgi:hypothetical protein